MSARLTTAIKIADVAKAILQKTQSFPAQKFDELESLRNLNNIGVEPMFMALSMEMALKAWFVFDHDDPKAIKSHNLTKLYDGLKPESQQQLDAEFRRSVAPYHPNLLHTDYGFRNILFQHQDALVEWRYFYERKRSMHFEMSAFEATLEMMLKEFRKRHRVERVNFARSSQ